MYKQIALKKIAKACDEVKIDTKTKMEVDAQRKEIEAQTEVLVVCKSGNLTIVWLNLSDQIEKLGQETIPDWFGGILSRCVVLIQLGRNKADKKYLDSHMFINYSGSHHTKT